MQESTDTGSSEEEEDEDKVRANYFELQIFYEDDCTELLRKVLQKCFPNYESLVELVEKYQSDNPNGIISKENKLLIEKEGRISKRFKFELLANIFRTGICDASIDTPSNGWLSESASLPDHQSVGDNILKLWQIWFHNISKNADEEVSDNDCETIWSNLKNVAECMAKTFETFGKKFRKKIEKKMEQKMGTVEKSKGSNRPTTINSQVGENNKIEHTGLENSAENIVNNQYGSKNKITSQHQASVKTVVCHQEGEKCRIAVKLVNQTDSKFDFDIEGKDLRLTMRSSDKEAWPEIADKIGRLSIKELNEDQRLKDSAVEITAIQNACLIVDVKITRTDIENSLCILVECFLKRSNALQILRDKKVSEVNIFGYYYQPYNYIEKTDLDMNFVLVNHTTLKLRNTISDIDVFVSDSLSMLIQNSFKADVDESIRVQIKGDVVDPETLRFSDIQRALTDQSEQQLKSISNSLVTEWHLQIIDVLRRNSATHIILKTECCITYGCLTEKKGPIVTLLQKIFQMEALEEKISEVSVMRVGVMINTSMDEEFHEDSGKGIVIFLRPESKIAEAIEENKFPDLLHAMLGEKSGEIMRGVEQLKIRAVLDYGNGRNGEDSDQAIDITDIYERESPEEEVVCCLKEAKSALHSGNLFNAKRKARESFQKLNDEDIDDFEELLKVFQECADNFYALKCFCKVRLLGKEYWNPLTSLITSRNYWINVIGGPYELENIVKLFEEIESMSFRYLNLDDYRLIASGICCELQISYGELVHKFRLPRDDRVIIKRMRAVDYHLCMMYYKQGYNNLICTIYKQRDRDGDALDAENLYMWAKVLKDQEKFDVALKKIVEAIQVYCSETSTANIPDDFRDLRDALILDLNQMPKTQSNLDVTWLAGTNISMPQQMKEKAQMVKTKHVKSVSRRRPKRPERENPEASLIDKSEQSDAHYEDTSKYKTWKDIPRSVPDSSEKNKKGNRRHRKNTNKEKDYNVELIEMEMSESDSGQESFSENEHPKKKPFTYEEPEYQVSEIDTSVLSDSGFDTLDDEYHFDNTTVTEKTLSNSELVIFGITLTDRCKDSFQKKRKTGKKFPYQAELSKEELLRLLKSNTKRYKKCTVEIESAHKAVCRNLDMADVEKEIIISGRSKCGKTFTDDEVVVEILGESKAHSTYIPRLKIDSAKEKKDNNIYGKIMGKLKRNRYGDLDNPVLICAKDEFADHMMKPLCKTVPKIKVYHKNCKHKYQVDLFSYDASRNVVEHRETLDINHAYKKACCFLVAILSWDDMYPFGITLDVINTKGDIKSGLGILKLQYRVPFTFRKETTEAANLILKRKQKTRVAHRNLKKVFTINDGKQGAMEVAYSVEVLESGLHRIGVHIIDPTSFIKKGDAIDTEARRRGTDFYVNKEIQPIYMIPECLSNDLFSLDIGKERNTLAVFFDGCIDDDSSYEKNDIEGRVERTIVKSETQYDIAYVQRTLKGKSVEDEIHILYRMSQKLRKNRLGNAFHFTDVNEMFPYEKNNFIECMDAHLLVQELHIFANRAVAKFLLENYPECIPFKCHDRPPQDVLIKWREAHIEHMDKILFQLQDCELDTGAVCSVFNCNPDSLRYRHLISVQNNVWDVLCEAAKSKQYDKLQLILGADEIHPLQALALEEWIEIQETAEYRCSNQKHGVLHFDLRVPIYTFFTAPLSRFMDLVVHRLVNAALDNKKPPYDQMEIQKICEEMNSVNRTRKQFRKSCLILLFSHSLNKDPRVYNGFIQNVTNNDVELVFPTLRKLSRSSKLLPINLLHSKQKPEFQKEIGTRRFFMTLKWNNRIYSLKRVTKNPPKENEYLRIDPNQNVQFHQLKKWVKIMLALLKCKTKNIHSLLVAADQPAGNQQIPTTWHTVNDVSSEVRGGYFAQQTCNYSMSFSYGQLVVIQMSAEPEKGIMTPLPQLLDITPNVKICLQHVRDPLGILSSMATKSTKQAYSSCKEFIDIWMPIFAMEVATQTTSGDSFTINDLPVTFRVRGGAFSLKQSFLEKRDIEFTSHAVHLLNTEDDEKDKNKEENERFYMSGSDFLCIRCPLNPKSDIVSNFGNGAISPRRRYWIGHAKVHDVHSKTKKNEKVVSVAFVCHNRSPPIPKEMLNQKKECSVEILRKSNFTRRTELYVKLLENASELAIAIALRRRVPDLDDIHKELGDQGNLEVSELEIAYNEKQRTAVEKALTSSFSLIQGPPGTGKTFTAVALISLFCNINQMLSERKKVKKHFVLFCGPSNKSVDLVTAYLKNICGGKMRILRIYGAALENNAFPIPGKAYPKQKTECAPDESLREVTLHHIIRKPGNEYAEKIRDFDRKFKIGKSVNHRDIKEYNRYIARAVREEIPRYDVILCTTAVATSARLLNATARSIYQLVIDEAGMCTEPECLATIVATQAKQVVLIGDHKQLQPVVQCQEAGELGLQKSLFERYAESQKSNKHLTLLTIQYRMHPSLCRFPSSAFYDKQLITNPSPKRETLQALSIWRDPNNPFVFCDMEGDEEYLENTSEEGNEMSRFNRAEINQVEKVYLHLVKREGVSPENINVMSQYNAQCCRIRERLRKHNVQHVNTVVASQGGEWDYVIFSLVRSLPEYRIEPDPTEGWCKENLGFITDEHQINVALTRARKGLVIIGNRRLMQCSDIFKKLLDEYVRNGCVENAENFPPKQEQHKTWIP